MEDQHWEKSNLYKIQLKNSPLQVEELSLDQLTPEKFRSITRNRTIPVVLKGLISDTEAVKKWNKEYFTKYSNTLVKTIVNNNMDKIGAYTTFTRALDVQKISLGDFLNNLDTQEKTMYINNVTSIFISHPELIDDLNMNILENIGSKLTRSSCLKINLFMGGSGTGSSLHCAVGGNFFFNICGRKKWILIDPKYSKFLRSTHAKDSSFVISGRDIENPDKVLMAIPKYEVVLEPGDVLYNAPWWWHYVKNESNFTIGCAVRDHFTYWQSLYNNPMYMIMSPYIYKLFPPILWLASAIYGEKNIFESSMKSDKFIMKHLSN